MKNTITCTKNTASATYLPYAAYKSALALAAAHKGKIDKTAEGNFKATFSSAKVAKKFVAEWTAEYEANRKAVPAPAPAQKPKASKGNSAPSPKEMTAEEEYNLAYDFVVANGIEDPRVLVHLGALQKAAQAERDAKKAKPSKKPTTSSTKKSTKKTAPKKPTASKGNAFDYSVIKGKTKSDKNRALHAMLVSMGIADSRTPEYQAVWTARPWAK